MPKNNPYISLKKNGISVKSGLNAKASAWVCTGDKPMVVTVNFDDNNTIDLNLKSLLAALKFNELI